MKKAHRIGIVGLRGIAAQPKRDVPPPFRNEIIVSHTAAIDLVAGAEVAGYCDLAPELLDSFAEKWGRRWPNAHGYTDYREMLAKEDLDILTVATSDHRHADITVDGAESGLKGVFVEKPLATSIEDADRMIKACEDRGVVLIVDHTRRWKPMFHAVREAIRGGAIGPLSTILAQRGGPRAMLFRNGTHVFDSVCFFAESEPVQVWAQLEPGFEDWDRYKGDGGHDPANDPAAMGFILFKNGVRALYTGEKDTTDLKDLHLTGPDGQIFFHIDDHVATWRATDPDDSNRFVLRTIRPGYYQVHGIVAAYEELIRLIESGGDGQSSALEARKTVQIMVGFLKSHQQGSRLVDVPG